MGLVSSHCIEYIGCWKLQVSHFVSIVRELFCTDHPSIAMICFAPFGKRTNFHTKKGFSRKEKCLECVSSYWSQCKHLEPTEHLVGEWLHWPSWNRGLGGKNARVAFHCKPQLGFMFFHWVEFTLTVGWFKTIVFYHLWCCTWVLIILVMLCLFLPCSGNEKKFMPKKFLQEGEHICCGCKFREAHCK